MTSWRAPHERNSSPPFQRLQGDQSYSSRSCRSVLDIVYYLDGVPNLHPLLIQDTPHTVQLVNVRLCQAAPVLAQVIDVQFSDVLLVRAQFLKICTSQAPASCVLQRHALQAYVPTVALDLRHTFSCTSLSTGHRMGQCNPRHHSLLQDWSGHCEGPVPDIHLSKRPTMSAISSLK